MTSTVQGSSWLFGTSKHVYIDIIF